MVAKMYQQSAEWRKKNYREINPMIVSLKPEDSKKFHFKNVFSIELNVEL